MNVFGMIFSFGIPALVVCYMAIKLLIDGDA
jgi:hypothetical protein